MPKPPTIDVSAPPPAEVVAGLQSENAKLKAERDEYRRLYLDALALARRLELGVVGRGREKDAGDASALSLLALMAGGSAPTEPAPEPEAQDVAGHKRRKPTGRRPLPENLPRVEIEILPEEVKQSGLENFERIGEDVRETVERRPAAVVVVREVRPKFVPKGQARGDETTVLQGEALELPIPRGLAGPGLLADTIVKRWSDHTPLHRMERIYGRDGLELSRQTICGWHLALSELVALLLAAMWADAQGSPYLCVDATGVLVQHADKCRNGHFFVVIAPERHVLFRFSEKHNNAAVDALFREANRGEVHRPIVDAFEAWCDAEALKVVDESPLAKALSYARNQRAALRTFLDDGRIPRRGGGGHPRLSRSLPRPRGLPRRSLHRPGTPLRRRQPLHAGRLHRRSGLPCPG